MVESVPIGSLVGGYRIEGLISSSPTGASYRARGRAGDVVALELVAPELAAVPGYKDRLGRAERQAGSLNHPAIARVIDVGEADGSLYVASEWVEGTDLATLIEQMGTLSFLRAAGIALQAAEALDAAHAAGLLHGGLEPRRILVSSEEGTDRVIVAGFLSLGHTPPQGPGVPSEDWIGPPPADYAAPEQIRLEQLGPATDVYGLGCVLYEAAAGMPPFPRASVEGTLSAHLGEPAPAPSQRLLELPAEFDEVIWRALTKHPEERYQSAGELAKAALWAGGVVPPPTADRQPDKAGVISAWQRSLAAGAHLWSPSGSESAGDTQAVVAETPESPDADAEPAAEPQPASPTPASPAAGHTERPGRGRRRLRIAAGGVALAAATGTVVLLALGSDGGDSDSARSEPRQEQRARGDVAVPPTGEWPRRNGYTVVVGVSSGNRKQAEALAARARRQGFRAGVLSSGAYSSLEPGKLVTFVGVHPSAAAARREATAVSEAGLASAPYVRFVNGGS